MAKKQQSQGGKNAPTTKAQPVKEKKQAQGPRGKTTVYAAIALIIIVAAAVAVYLAYYGGSSNSNASFSTFKSNFDSAQRVAVLLSFSNNTQLNYELECSTTVLQVLSSKRSPSSIDFFEINQTGCDYSAGLGYPINLTSPNITTCLSKAQAEPGIFFNYSATFSNTITQRHMYISGNSTFFTSCPIAVDLR